MREASIWGYKGNRREKQVEMIEWGDPLKGVHFLRLRTGKRVEDFTFLG